MSTEGLTKEAIELLSNLIRIPRTSRNETEAAQFLKDYMEQNCKLPVQCDGCNLWSIAPNYKPNLPTLLLNAHIDTVKPVSDWKHDPFTPQIEDGKLYGLGSNDDGSSLVSLCSGRAVSFRSGLTTTVRGGSGRFHGGSLYDGKAPFREETLRCGGRPFRNGGRQGKEPG